MPPRPEPPAASLPSHWRRLTPQGRAFALGAVLFVGAALAVQAKVILILGAAGLMLLAHGRQRARRVQEALLMARPEMEALTLEGSPFESRFPLTQDRSPTLRCQWHGLSVGFFREDDPVDLGSVKPICTGGLRGEVRAFRQRGEIALDPKRPGEAWLQGLSVRLRVAFGLYEVQVFVPYFRAFFIHPRAQRAGGRLQAGVADQRGGLLTLPRSALPGFSTDLRQLRAFRAGDAFRDIAWRASARQGRLISREYAPEGEGGLHLHLYTGPSLDDAPLGEAKRDRAMALGLEILRRAQQSRLPTSLSMGDHQLRYFSDVIHGAAPRHGLVEALCLGSSPMRLEDVALDAEGLQRQAVQWLRSQLPRPPWPHAKPLEQLSTQDLAAWLAPWRRRLQRVGLPRAAASDAQIFFDFGRLVGLPMPPAQAPEVRPFVGGLDGAWRVAQRRPELTGPRLWVLIADAPSVVNLEPLAQRIHGIRRQGHRVLCYVVPPSPHPVQSMGEQQIAALVSAATRAHERVQARELSQRLSPHAPTQLWEGGHTIKGLAER